MTELFERLALNGPRVPTERVIDLRRHACILAGLFVIMVVDQRLLAHHGRLEDQPVTFGYHNSFFWSHPGRAVNDAIFAVLTCMRKLPKPIKMIIGDLSAVEKVLVGLNVHEI